MQVDAAVDEALAGKTRPRQDGSGTRLSLSASGARDPETALTACGEPDPDSERSQARVESDAFPGVQQVLGRGAAEVELADRVGDAAVAVPLQGGDLPSRSKVMPMDRWPSRCF